jgi:thioester reductase-like protein
VRFKEFYAGKTLLITGCTGFLGKVILEKILRCLPDVRRIYVMLRPRKNQNIVKRTDAIFEAPVFDRLFAENPNLKKQMNEKIFPISGDLILEGLGISPEDRARIVNEVDLIINSAASVNFDDPLLDAIQINYFGCMRMLDLAKECKKLESLVHVSTAYVNSDKPGFLEEKIYDCPGGEDPEKVIEDILQMNPQYISDNE